VNFSCAEALPLAAKNAASASASRVVAMCEVMGFPFPLPEAFLPRFSRCALGPRLPTTAAATTTAPVEQEPHDGNPGFSEANATEVFMLLWVVTMDVAQPLSARPTANSPRPMAPTTAAVAVIL